MIGKDDNHAPSALKASFRSPAFLRDRLLQPCAALFMARRAQPLSLDAEPISAQPWHFDALSLASGPSTFDIL